MKTIFAIFTLLIVAIFSIQSFSKNISINTTGNAADPSAILDINASNKGLLIPRVALQSATDGATIVSPATSLMVYSQGGVLTDGYYYNSGTPASPVWVMMINSTSTSSCAQSCTWTLVAVASSGAAGNTGTFSSGYTVTTGKEVLVVVIGNPVATPNMADACAIFPLSFSPVAAVDERVRNPCYAFNSPAVRIDYLGAVTGATDASITVISGNLIKNASATYSLIGISGTTANQRAKINGTGLIALEDNRAFVTGGLYIFER